MYNKFKYRLITSFLTTMTFQISKDNSSIAYGTQIRHWTVVTFIAISLLFIILSDVEDVTAQLGVTTDEEFLNNFIGLTNKSGALTNSYQQEIGNGKIINIAMPQS